MKVNKNDDPLLSLFSLNLSSFQNSCFPFESLSSTKHSRRRHVKEKRLGSRYALAAPMPIWSWTEVVVSILTMVALSPSRSIPNMHWIPYIDMFIIRLQELLDKHISRSINYWHMVTVPIIKFTLAQVTDAPMRVNSFCCLRCTFEMQHHVRLVVCE